MSFACIFVPDFPVEAALRAEPELRQSAVAVLQGTPPLARVMAVNEGARQAGVEIGMTKLQASARTPQVEFRNRSALAEAAAHAALLDCACAFSPKIEDTSADTVILDLAGLGRLFGSASKIARDLATRASQMGLEANVAVAANADAAMHAARGFPGVTVIPPGKEAERLGLLPLEVLGPPPDMLETLDRWGVRNLRAFAALPEISVSERLGQPGVRLQKLARGEGSRPLVAAEPPLNFEEAIELEYPVSLLEPLAFILNRMLEQLCARLSARALATQELRLRCELDSGQWPVDSGQQDSGQWPVASGQEEVSSFQFPVSGKTPSKSEIKNQKSEIPRFHERALRLPVPMLDAKLFLKLLQLDLKSHPPAAPVLKLWLAAEPVRARATQGGLFLPLAPEPEKLELTLARLSGVAGEGRVGAAELLDTHRAERFRIVKFEQHSGQWPVGSGQEEVSSFQFPVSSAKPGKSEIRNWKSEIRKDPITALRVFRPPLRAKVDVSDGHPVRLAAQAQEGNQVSWEVVWLAGPWRISGEWWSEQPWSREVWDMALRNEAGVALYRVFRDDRGWFVEGSYD